MTVPFHYDIAYFAVILSYRYEESDLYKEQPPCSLRKLGGNILCSII